MAGFVEKILNSFKREMIDPAIFNDPLALTTSWEPAKRGGANFKTRVNTRRW